MKVICVDDERLILQRTVSILRRFPQVESVEGFLSGREALDYLIEHPADVAIMDINMPGMDGLELGSIIRSQYDNMKIVFLTGYYKFELEAYKMHANGYLLKPVDEDELLEEVEKLEKLA